MIELLAAASEIAESAEAIESLGEMSEGVGFSDGLTDNPYTLEEANEACNELFDKENPNISNDDIITEPNINKNDSFYDADSLFEYDEDVIKELSDERSDINETKDDINNNEYNNLNSMKNELGKTYSEIKENKPPNSPNISKWFENGGTIRIEEINDKKIWTYTDSAGRSVQYIDGQIKFPPEAKHPVIDDINIGEFTGKRTKDKELYLEKLEEEYGLTEIPEGYKLHHDTENGIMQLIKEDYHKEFTHIGGHSIYKEIE